ncbi:MAG: RNA polymerase sigma factor [Saprospiraceae bacterium]
MYSLSIQNQEFSENYLTLTQFETMYQQELETWLITEGFCQTHEVKYLKFRVLISLKSSFSLTEYYQSSLIWKSIPIIAKREYGKIKKLMEKNFGLSELAFQELAEQLQAGDERLFEQIFLSHYKDCIAYLMKNYGASHEDAYDATMETLLNFHKGIKAAKINYGNLRFLFTKMASQVYIKWIKRENLKNPIQEMDLVEDPKAFDKETLQLLDQAWAGLCEDCAGLLKKFYYENISLKEIALKLNKSPEAIRKQKQRCVEKLKSYFLRIS